VFAVSRFMGPSIAMIDDHYGHLTHDSRRHAVSLLDALALERAVDAAWTSTRTGSKPVEINDSRRGTVDPLSMKEGRWVK
jgi:hypothetical protein